MAMICTNRLSCYPLTDIYATATPDGSIYLRADIDSAHHVCDEDDWQREEQTGIPSYVGWQMEITSPCTAYELLEQIQLAAKKITMTKSAISALFRLVSIREMAA